jgi:hypothetical protein
MRLSTDRRHRAVLAGSACVWLTVVPASIIMAQEREVTDTFLLSSGVVVNLDRGQAYVAKPEGEISAIDLSTGIERWRSSQAAVPIGVGAVANVVGICLAQSPVR